jgi:hypothetical protein
VRAGRRVCVAGACSFLLSDFDEEVMDRLCWILGLGSVSFYFKCSGRYTCGWGELFIVVS